MNELEKLILKTAPPHYGTPDAPNTWEALQAYKDIFPLPVLMVVVIRLSSPIRPSI